MATRRLFNGEALTATTVATFIIALCIHVNASTTTVGVDRTAIGGGEEELDEHDDGRSIDEILIAPPPPGNRTRGRFQSGHFVKVELDILYTVDQWTRRIKRNSSTRFRRNATSNQTLLWPNAMVPHEIPANWGIKQRRLLAAAMKPYRTHTCIRFVESDSSLYQGGSIVIIDDLGDCSSPVGRQEDPQPLSLSSQCMTVGTIIHELGHAIGLYHEHNRPDRDEYVTINWENIQGVSNNESVSYEFHKNDPSEVDVMDTRYDYLSIMHYGQKAFSKNEKNTIVAKNSTYQNRMGMSRNLLFSDIKRINSMYKCADRSNCRKKTCPDGGFVAKDCRCWCPSTMQTKEPIELCRCVNYDVFCDAFKGRGLCTRRLFKNYMEEMCPRSCGVCSFSSTSALLRG